MRAMNEHVNVTGLDRTRAAGPRRASVAAWYGIRYAELASGRRFSPPCAVAGGPLGVPALRDVPCFPQRGSGRPSVLGEGDLLNPQMDDAFFINVWAPEGADGLPVVVFVHGGGWTSGGGSVPWYDGRHLAAGGLVVVTVNYRIGPVGHLAADATSELDDPSLPVQDMLTALRWVADNAARYGGDPDRITLAGQSAGGWLVHLLTLIPEASGLFRRAAIWSMGTRVPRSPTLRRELVARAAELCTPASLAEVPTVDLLDIGTRALDDVLPPVPFGHARAGWVPYAGESVPIAMMDPAFAAARCCAEAVFFRNTADETGTFFHDAPALRATTDEQVWGWIETLPSDALPRGMLGDVAFHGRSPYEKIVAISSWLQYQGPARALAGQYAAEGIEVVGRDFGYRGAVDGQLSGHCLDLPFQFGTREEWADAPMLKACSDDEFDRISHNLIAELTAFASAVPLPFAD